MLAIQEPTSTKTLAKNSWGLRYSSDKALLFALLSMVLFGNLKL